ncbi:MAG: GNAT family N-acetyltransferase [Acidovorax sp.]|uniref:GNAT family N-acetyltransferase n=1 Tax=Acidovorax sp. TaxID=1872122 RepID=UPI00260D94E5|nr:GNAT family N-acetyltransferase [Acidovorax sp.]MDH4464956.1 GNAT family N-acetyltransferase [Acidovorax sp.]
MPIHLRTLTASDAPAYKALRDESLRTAPEAFTSDWASTVGRDASEYAGRFGEPATGNFFLGAFDDANHLLGCVGCEREARLQQRHCAHVVSMMVAPRAQRRGIGQQLVAACIDAARQVPGLTQLLLTVTASNTHVVRLYEQAGFRAWGLLPCAIVVDGVGYDKLHMRRLLTSPTGLDGHNQQPAP